MNKTIEPQVLSTNLVSRTLLFKVEEVTVKFTNGAEATLEKLSALAPEVVMIVPILDCGKLVLINEYCPGTGRYELKFPTGRVENFESYLETANRELIEEVGFGSRRLTELKTIYASPGHCDQSTTICLAQDLFPQHGVGDELYKSQITLWDIKDWRSLLAGRLSDARSIAALFISMTKLNNSFF